MEQFNISAFLFINQYAGNNKSIDQMLIGLAEATPYVFIVILGWLWFSGKLAKMTSSYQAGLAVLLGMLTSYSISLFYYHSRPFVQGLGTQLVEHAPDSSFPSDHTTFIFCIAIMLLFNKSTRRLAYLLSGISLISGLSRVYVGVHFPLDIIGAILVAIGSSIVVFSLRHKTKWLLSFLVKIIPFSAVKEV
ncbi:undecaprenyl-diphosphatase [Rheinheimera sp. MMS21-TC3]|uniref:undecaprenyl-diphosphatase n=1 Tax=Rheinheimera sp. MMS21-TC3 TaxID=3072790 RepID=UPI0028C3F457|nr:undecaprenyl-diphosphatase [Rheinheimera sp. MMS21-TC3]WNO59413.1 undecaprenyl-diphosphatase [Rheinheimera sp. MMS21-TC3]WNO62250.1 undecaprenyl-diphosphatase [Rheinheimera sp. MMS21-TC3]